jgi:hypothetical protein
VAAVHPKRTSWFFSNDNGATWVPVNGNGLELRIKDIREVNEGEKKSNSTTNMIIGSTGTVITTS